MEILANERKRWTREDKDFLKKNYQTMSITDMSEHLKRTRSTIISQCKFLNLNVPEFNLIKHTKYRNIVLKRNGDIYASANVSNGLRSFKDMIEEHFHNIRPALLRGEVFTIEAQ